MPAPIAAASPTRNVARTVGGKGRGKERRERRDRAVHEAGEAGLHVLQHEHAARGLILRRPRARLELCAQLAGKRLVLVLGGGELGQQIAHRRVLRGFRGAAVEPCRLELHLLGEFSGGVDRQRPVEPDRAARDEAFDVLAADQRQKIAEFLAMQIEQHVAMADLLIRHLVVYRRRIRV